VDWLLTEKRRTLGVHWYKDIVSNKERVRHMEQGTATDGVLAIGPRDALGEILRKGAQDLLAQSIEQEVEAYLAAHAHPLDEAGHRLVVRNGHKKERQIQTGVGPVLERRPRVDDRRQHVNELVTVPFPALKRLPDPLALPTTEPEGSKWIMTPYPGQQQAPTYSRHLRRHPNTPTTIIATPNPPGSGTV